MRPHTMTPNSLPQNPMNQNPTKAVAPRRCHKPLILLSALLLAACADMIPETKKIDYKSMSRRAPTLEVPPDLTQLSRDDRFTVPDSSGMGSATFSQYSAERSPDDPRQAQTSTILPEIENLRIERSGSQRWLVAKIPSDRLWESVKDFWQELGFVIATESPETGVMETDWAENRANIPSDFIRNTIGRVLDSLYSTSERDKFRTRFEPSDEPGATDVFISNRRMEEVYTSTAKDDTRWQPASSDPELEAEMLRRLMIRLGSDERRAEAAIAVAQKTENRARIVTSNADSSLEVQERFDRAWRRTGLALDRVGFTVEDRDRSKGLYFVRYVDPDEGGKKKEGWFSNLFSWGSGKKAAPPIQYRIHLRAVGEATRIEVLPAEGETNASEGAQKILALLLEQLR